VRAGRPVALKLNAYALPPDTSFQDLLTLADEAENAGFDGVYLIDHLFMPNEQLAGFSSHFDRSRPFFPDPWSLMPAIAARTRTLRIGPQVAPIMRMHPVVLARSGATIDWLSGGRFVLQVGAGWNADEYRAFGLPYSASLTERYRRLNEGIRLIQALWDSESAVTFDGEFYSLAEAPLWPKPLARPRPPIWIGGNSAGARTIVAQVGDGWTPAPPHYGGMTPDAYAKGVSDIRDQARAFGRPPEAITAGGHFFVVVEETQEKARDVAQSLLHRDIWRDLTVSELAERGIAFIGTPQQILRGIARFVDAGLEYLTVSLVPISPLRPTLRRMSLFREVLDELAAT
jgi:probable F420-dependent oxidoreductase